MRVLEITDSVGWSGGAQQTLFLCEGLNKKGHEVILACCKDSDIEKRAREKRIKIETLKMHQEYDIAAIFKLKKIIEKYNIEIVHAHHPKAHALGLAASFITGVPVFIYTRRVIFPIRRGVFSQLKYKSKRINKIVAVSEGVKKILVEYGLAPDRIEVIYGGIDLREILPRFNGQMVRKEFNIADDESLVALIGNFSYYKGHTFFLEAIPLILRKMPKTKFILVGRDTDAEELRDLVDKLNIKQNTILAGFRTDIPEILAAAELTVNASLQEALAGTIRESLAMGKPVVATLVGGNPEMIKHKETGLLVPPEDAQALADGVITLLADKQLAKEMGLKGHQLVEEKFSVENMVNKTEELYAQLLKAKKGQGISDPLPVTRAP